MSARSTGRVGSMWTPAGRQHKPCGVGQRRSSGRIRAKRYGRERGGEEQMVTTANWRQLGEADIPALLEVQKEAYPWHQEGPAMFLDRMRIYPHGCLAFDGPDGMLGYILSHP